MTKHAWVVLACMGLVGCGVGPAGGGGGARPSPTPSYYPPPGGGGGLPGPTPGPSSAPMPGPSAAPSTSAAEVVVVQNFQFAPSTLVVSPGTVVTWRFMDAVAHTSTSNPGSSESWDSGLLANGQTYSHTFNRMGSFAYHCQAHPSMTGTIVVR